MKALVYDELKENMEKALQSLERSFAKVRTGRASLGILDGIRVDEERTVRPRGDPQPRAAQGVLQRPWLLGPHQDTACGEKLGLRAVRDDPPVVDHDEVVGHHLHLAQQVRGEQHRAAAVRDIPASTAPTTRMRRSAERY